MQVHSENGQSQFNVSLCTLGTSPDIQSAIWRAQHHCVSDHPELLDDPNYDDITANQIPLTDSEAGNAIIKHQLGVEHYSVLDQAFVKFNVLGFPHSTIAQITRHRDSAFLVTSMRYTGQKFIEVSQGKLDVDRAFYVRPPGVYRDRSGSKIEWTQQDRENLLNHCLHACLMFESLVKRGSPWEHARELLPYCYRQPFTIACTVKNFFHLLDQRTKADSEREIQITASMMLEEFKCVAPELGNWYQEKRFGKARLAP